MDDLVYVEKAATEATALRNARGRAEKAGMYVLRQRCEDITGDALRLERTYRVTLLGRPLTEEPERE